MSLSESKLAGIGVVPWEDEDTGFGADDAAGSEFQQLLESNFSTSDVREGTIVKGKVIALENDFVTVDVGLKTEGRVSVKEFKDMTESGEFTEVVKKIILQGKPYNEDNVFHMKRELGDICWYIAQACMALDTTFDEVIDMNVDKLKARYPGGEFDVHKSENRKDGDV